MGRAHGVPAGAPVRLAPRASPAMSQPGRREPARQRLASGVGDTQPPDWLQSDAAEGAPRPNQPAARAPHSHATNRSRAALDDLFLPGRLLRSAPSMDGTMPLLCNAAVTGEAANSSLRLAFSGLWKIV